MVLYCLFTSSYMVLLPGRNQPSENSVTHVLVQYTEQHRRILPNKTCLEQHRLPSRWQIHQVSYQRLWLPRRHLYGRWFINYPLSGKNTPRDYLPLPRKLCSSAYALYLPSPPTLMGVLCCVTAAANTVETLQHAFRLHDNGI